jgi:S-methylmethionine-dependent homocysteine/selenocysteine methylase
MLAAAPPRSRALLLAVLLGLHWVPTLLRAAPVRQPAAWGAWQQFEDEGMLAVMDRGPALVDHTNKGDKSAVSQWHCVSQLEQPELLLRQHEWDLNVGASVLVANTGCSSRLALLRAGLGRRVREATTRAVEIAQEARQQAQCDSPHSASSCLRS